MTENAALVVGVDGSEGSRAALIWSAQEAHRRQLPLRVDCRCCRARRSDAGNSL